VRSYRGGTPSDRWLINCSARRFRRSRYGWTNQVTSLIGMIPLGSSVAQEIQRLCRVAPTRSASSAGSNLGRVSRRASLGQPPSARAARDRSPDRGQDSLFRGPYERMFASGGRKRQLNGLCPPRPYGRNQGSPLFAPPLSINMTISPRTARTQPVPGGGIRSHLSRSASHCSCQTARSGLRAV
jgi:hypothetical protein